MSAKHNFVRLIVLEVFEKEEVIWVAFYPRSAARK